MHKLIVIFIVSISRMLTGCPKGERTIRLAREKSAEMAIYGEKIVQANIDAFKTAEISRELFTELTQLTGKFTVGLGEYRAALSAAEVAIKNGADPKSILDQLYGILDDKVVAAFFALLARANVLSGPHAETIRFILASLRLTIRAVQGAFADAQHELGYPEVNYATA
jgi:hypothetical protein